ncbi:uncharacterized protein [Epargyreus clarus]|uniref:uncharacterized protein isoform X2 n=1 Tax=Epargyreus clarus TaxID=520877 RepID=UPI003C2EDA8E
MWQPPGGLSGPPALIPEPETPPEQSSLTTTFSSSETPNPQIADPLQPLQIPSATRVSRVAVPRKRANTSQFSSEQQNLSENGSSWLFKYEGCPTDQPDRRFRMANLYDMQYSSNNLLHAIPREVIPNVNVEGHVPHRFLTKRQHPEAVTIQSNEELPRENLWPLKHRRFSNYSDDDFSVISSYARPQIVNAEISTFATSDSSTDSEIPNLFRAHIDNATICDYSSVIGSNSTSCVNPSTSITGYQVTEHFSGTVTSSILENTDSNGSEMSNSEATSTKYYGAERTYERKFTSEKHNDLVLVEFYKLHGSRNLNLPPSTVQAQKVANRVITHTRLYKTLDERAIWCLNCDRIPTFPVTGQCGHTRCSKCVKENDTCPCGTPAPRSPCLNTVIQGIIDKMLHHEPGTRVTVNSVVLTNDTSQRKCPLPTSSATATSRRTAPCRKLRRSSNDFISPKKSISTAGTEWRVPMTPQNRFKRARELLSSGHYGEAAPLLARVAATTAPLARLARTLLAQSISALSVNGDPRRITRELYRSIRLQSAVSWLKPSDLECVLCYHTYTCPVTTPCGHTYCRTCIERSLDYRKKCALCLRPLDDFNLAATRETEFVSAALAAIDAVSAPPPPDPDVIPIFVCTVAFPSIPCPLFIFDPRYWMMIRRILESGSRKFGMVAYERDRSYSDYGTVLEVCDCVHLEDGRSILSTVGVSRFRVIERDVHDGCDVARIQPLVDVTPSDDMIWELRVMATQISYKALVWLDSMNRAVRAEIEAAFGPMPHFDSGDDWWERVDGPKWLWWLIAILPLRSEIKILILSTRSLLKRMMAVTRTLEVMDSVAFNNNSNTECDLGTALSTEEWLERNA